MSKTLISLKNSLVAEQFGNAEVLAQDMYDVWNSKQSKFKRSELTPFAFLMSGGLGPAKNVLIRISNILEAKSKVILLTQTSGAKIGANWKAKYELWNKQLINQIIDCLKQIKKKK